MEAVKSKTKEKATFKKLGFSKADTLVLVESVNTLLADYVVHYHKP